MTRTTTRTTSLLLALALALVIAILPATPASADPPFRHPMPAGNWTHVRTDAYIHYACKVPSSGADGPVYRVHTRSWSNGRSANFLRQYGVYAVVTRSSNQNRVSETVNRGWLYGYNGNAMWASAYFPDRLWIQAQGFGLLLAWATASPSETS